MPRYKITIEYDGTGFVGWQRQKDGISIQEVLETAISRFCNTPTSIMGAGRTDAGVHALGQVAHFDSPKEYEPFKIINGINYYLHDYKVSILSTDKVSDEFHSRFDAIERSYIYRILNRRSPPALEYYRLWHVPPLLDIKKMQEASEVLIGKHDFSAFRSIECQAKSPVKTLNEIKITSKEDEIQIYIKAPSFLHNQVRIITGTLYNVGLGKWTKADVKRILEEKNRNNAGPTAPAYGLYLTEVKYP